MTRLATPKAQYHELLHAGHVYLLPSSMPYDQARLCCLDWQQNPQLPFDFVASNAMLDKVRESKAFPSEPE